MLKKKMILLIIICMLILPGVWAVTFGGIQIYAIDENRVLSTFSKENWRNIFIDRGEYCKSLEAYFNDRFGFRDLFIRTKGEINYRLFNVTGENGVYVGKDGNLFYKNVVAKKQIWNEGMSVEERRNLLQLLRETKLLLNRNDKLFLFMIPPQKNEVVG